MRHGIAIAANRNRYVSLSSPEKSVETTWPTKTRVFT